MWQWNNQTPTRLVNMYELWGVMGIEHTWVVGFESQDHVPFGPNDHCISAHGHPGERLVRLSTFICKSTCRLV